MGKWTRVRLGDVATVVSGSTPKTNVNEYWNGNNYWVTPAEINDESMFIYETKRKITEKAIIDTNLKLLPKGTVLLTSRAPIGKVAIAGAEMYCNQGFKNLICSDRLNNEYLYWYLKSKNEYLNSLGRGATFKEISKSIVESIEITLPPVDVQIEIAKQLGQTKETQKSYNRLIDYFDNLAKSIFLNMFGDPRTNEKGWAFKKILDVSLEGLSYGSGASAVPYDGVTRYIRITDIQDDGSLSDQPVSPSEVSEKHFLEDGDILFARSGATVGKTFKYSKNYGRSIYAGYLIRMKPDPTQVHPDYVFGFTKTEYYRQFIESNKKTVAQPNINAQQYGNLLIPVPPLELQNRFAEIVSKIEEQKALIKKAIEETQLLFDSLMSKYFDD